MSLLPLLFSNWWEELDRPHHVQDQHFGLGLHPEHLSIVPTDIFEPRPPHPAAALLRHPHHHARRSPSTHSHYYRPWGELMRRESGGGLSTVKSDKENFQVVLDVQQFAPEEITVKVVDKHVVVEGNHEEKQDEHGWITRKFTRRYLIPEQCDLDKVDSKLSSDGVLTIVVARKDQPKEGGERVVSIQHTGKPAIRPKTDEKSVEEKKPVDQKK